MFENRWADNRSKLPMTVPTDAREECSILVAIFDNAPRFGRAEHNGCAPLFSVTREYRKLSENEFLYESIEHVRRALELELGGGYANEFKAGACYMNNILRRHNMDRFVDPEILMAFYEDQIELVENGVFPHDIDREFSVLDDDFYSFFRDVCPDKYDGDMFMYGGYCVFAPMKFEMDAPVID